MLPHKHVIVRWELNIHGYDNIIVNIFVIDLQLDINQL